jgi:hypothetical protein
LNDDIYSKLHAEGHLSDNSFHRIRVKQANSLFSVHWELKTLLYLGVMLLSGGLGTLVYKNIDTIGHQAVLAFIFLICAGCLFYCFKHKLPFSWTKVSSPNTGFDYILLLGTISLVTFVGYLQFQYQVFGLHYGMAVFIPMIALFFIAYYFDHIGVLGMAIASLGLWLGVSVNPKKLLAYGTFDGERTIYTYVAFGLLLLGFAWLSGRYDIKKHFKFSYQHYGIHVTFVALLAGYFDQYESPLSLLWLGVLLILAIGIYLEAYKEHSFYFILLCVFYCYFALACILTRLVNSALKYDGIYLLLVLFIGSAIGVIFLLIGINKKLKQHDHL